MFTFFVMHYIFCHTFALGFQRSHGRRQTKIIAIRFYFCNVSPGISRGAAEGSKRPVSADACKMNAIKNQPEKIKLNKIGQIHGVTALTLG
jgi:hypothetical protein